MDGAGRLLIAHPGHQLGVVVLAPGPHPADVKGQDGLDRPQRLLHIGADPQGRVHRDLEAGPGPGQGIGVHLGPKRRVVQRQPAVGDGRSLGHIAGAFGSDPDGDRPQRVGHDLQRLAQAGGAGAVVGVPVVVAVELQRLGPGEHPAEDLHVLPGAGQRAAEGLPVPALHHLGSRHPQPEDDPPAGDVVEGHGVHGHRRRGPSRYLHHAGAQLDPLGAGRDQHQRREGIRAPRLGRPHRVEPGLFGGHGQIHQALGHAPTPVPQRQTELHAASAPQTQPEPHARMGRSIRAIRCGSRPAGASR